MPSQLLCALAAVLALVPAGCGEGHVQPPFAVTDEAFTAGAVLDLPLDGAFPRIGLQWSYAVTAEGWPEGRHVPTRLAYRLTRTEALGHAWSGWWLYGTPPPGVPLRAEETGATITEDEVYFHPPRLYALVDLEVAPWPVAHPGRPGTRGSILTLGDGWEQKGRRIEKRYEESGPVDIEAAGRTWIDAWLVRGASEGWSAAFWWRPQVGWLRMQFHAEDGRRLELALTDVRDVAGSK